MKKKDERQPEVFGMSFLDCICCGFGAIILLLVLSKSAEPVIVEQDAVELQARQERLRQLAEQIAGEMDGLEADLAASDQQRRSAEQEVARLRLLAAALEDKAVKTETESTVAQTIEARLASAKQKLTTEMQRLYGARAARRPDAPVGGIPVDSEYIIFVVDTSGSMRAYAWNTVIDKLQQTLDLYPKVKGMQVMDDQGGYMFSQYRGRWIPDTPGRRRVVIDRMRSWQPFSNSNPVEGIEAAIRTFHAPDKKISIYVFGDDFTGGAIDPVLKRVRRINSRDARGNPRVRIHAVGFPTQYQGRGVTGTGVRFANLMRTLCNQNGGTFVGLSDAS